MEKNKINNNCEKCAYFVRHYANLHGKYYWVTGCQHCINHQLKIGEQKKRMNDLVVCEHWEPMQIQVQKRRESIEGTLRHMCELLEDIAQVLKEDNKTNEEKELSDK